jgi:REP element-mobilizing transposase RayT
MPQSLSRLHTHLIFNTKNRVPLISDKVRDSLHAYMAVVMQDMRCPPVLINSMNDHIHVLFDLSRTLAISQVVQDIKRTSSKWIKTQGPGLSHFAWQAGYGALAVSASHVEQVRQYIANQEEHHRQRTFQAVVLA